MLLYHVVAGKVMGADAMKMNGKMAKTVEGSSLNISVMGKVLEVNNAKVTKADALWRRQHDRAVGDGFIAGNLCRAGQGAGFPGN